MMNFEQRIGNIVGAPSRKESVADFDGRKAIEVRAELRKRGQEFRVRVLNMERPEDASAEEYDRSLALVFREAKGEAILDPGSAPMETFHVDAERFRKSAIEKEGIFPRYAGYLSARAAKCAEAIGEATSDHLAHAEACLNTIRDVDPNTPANLLPDAMILGLRAREAARFPMPDMKRVAEAAIADPALLTDYALTLPESDRNDFLALLPEERRRVVSVALDASVARVLHQSIVEKGSDEAVQRQSVQSRSERELRMHVQSPDSEEKAIVKILAQTVGELGGDDSARLLKSIGEEGLKRSNSHKENAARMSHVARTLRELFILDQSKGSMLAMKFLGKSELPERLFRYFLEGMMKEDFITKNASKYLVEEDIPVLKRIIAQYPNQLNTVIDTLSKIDGYALAGNEEEIFGAIDDLESITPVIFDRYRSADAVGKKALAERLRRLKPKFFQNTPIKQILPGKDREILAEMVYLAYKPVGMSFESVKRYIDRLEDKTDDLEEYSFPEEGYIFDLVSRKGFMLREGEHADVSFIRALRNRFIADYPQDEGKIREFSSALAHIAKAGTDVKPEELNVLFSIIARDELVQNFTERYAGGVEPERSYSAFNELKEILGVYFKDHYAVRLANLLSDHPEVMERIQKIFSGKKRQEVFERKLGREAIDWDETLNSSDTLSRLLGDFIFQKVLKSMREEINKNLNKFEEKEGGEARAISHGNLKAYISKNIGSFFAKASAGICTAEDIGLFEREDHFHINIVENEDFVRANIQAYIIKENGERSLVLRGFNPNIAFAEKMDVGAFCEKVIEIGKQFASENGMEHVFITDDLGGWHALSNRGNVQQYLVGRYKKEKNKKSFHLKIASSASVDSLFEV